MVSRTTNRQSSSSRILYSGLVMRPRYTTEESFLLCWPMSQDPHEKVFAHLKSTTIVTSEAIAEVPVISDCEVREALRELEKQRLGLGPTTIPSFGVTRPQRGRRESIVKPACVRR